MAKTAPKVQKLLDGAEKAALSKGDDYWEHLGALGQLKDTRAVQQAMIWCCLDNPTYQELGIDIIGRCYFWMSYEDISEAGSIIYKKLDTDIVDVLQAAIVTLGHLELQKLPILNQKELWLSS